MPTRYIMSADRACGTSNLSGHSEARSSFAKQFGDTFAHGPDFHHIPGELSYPRRAADWHAGLRFPGRPGARRK